MVEELLLFRVGSVDSSKKDQESPTHPGPEDEGAVGECLPAGSVPMSPSWGSSTPSRVWRSSSPQDPQDLVSRTEATPLGRSGSNQRRGSLVNRTRDLDKGRLNEFYFLSFRLFVTPHPQQDRPIPAYRGRPHLHGFRPGTSLRVVPAPEPPVGPPPSDVDRSPDPDWGRPLSLWFDP